jgi:hypothetical protein
LLAAAYGYSRLTTAVAFWAALRMRKPMHGITVGALFLVGLNVLIPILAFVIMRPGISPGLGIGMLQTSPFFAYICGGASATDQHFLQNEYSPFNIVWGLILALLCLRIASLLDRSSIFWLENAMRSETGAKHELDRNTSTDRFSNFFWIRLIREMAQA